MGARLRALREERGISQDQAARAIRSEGLPWSRSQLAKVERGDRAIGVEDLVLLSQAYATSLPELLDVDDPIALPGGRSITSAGLLSLFAGEHPDEGDLSPPERLRHEVGDLADIELHLSLIHI